MSSFVPKQVLIYYYILKKTYGILVKIYGNHVPFPDTCLVTWFYRFNTGDFDVEDKTAGKSSKNLELQRCKLCWTQNQ